MYIQAAPWAAPRFILPSCSHGNNMFLHSYPSTTIDFDSWICLGAGIFCLLASGRWIDFFFACDTSIETWEQQTYGCILMIWSHFSFHLYCLQVKFWCIHVKLWR
jgi:hypothetical protein